jgi:hypothetical protein
MVKTNASTREAIMTHGDGLIKVGNDSHPKLLSANIHFQPLMLISVV